MGCNFDCMHTKDSHMHAHVELGQQHTTWAVAAVPASCLGHEKV